MGNLEENPLILAVERSFPPQQWNDFPILVAVSGGPDSVALLRAMHFLASRSDRPHRLIVGHIDHQLRSSDSDADAVFVQELAADFGLPFHRRQLESPHDSPSEESLRNDRYRLLLQLAASCGARYLVTGHHVDDQAETILFRLCRGTGLAGLRGIPSYRVAHESVTIVRPLLHVTRSEIIQFLRQLNQDWREDRSNQSIEFTRNFLRQEILPKLEDRFGGSVAAALVRLSQQANQSQQVIDWLVVKMLEHVDFCSAKLVRLELEPLQEFPELAQQELLAEIFRRQNWPRGEMTAARWKQLAGCINSPVPSRFQLPGPIDVALTRQSMQLEYQGE